MPGSVKTRSYDLDGKVLWELTGMSTIDIPTPFAAHGLLFINSGYVGRRACGRSTRSAPAPRATCR